MPSFEIIGTIQGTVTKTVEAEDRSAALKKFEEELKFENLDEWDMLDVDFVEGDEEESNDEEESEDDE